MISTAQELLRELERQGVRITLQGEQLRCRAKLPLSTALQRRIADERLGLLALLGGRNVSARTNSGQEGTDKTDRRSDDDPSGSFGSDYRARIRTRQRLNLPQYFGPGRSDPNCVSCGGSGFEGRLGGKWTLCECRERSFRDLPENGGAQ